MAEFKHLILTRFNVRNWISPRPTTRKWLRHRFDLFDRICFPSVRSQTNQNFTWLLFFDLNTPTEFRTRIEHYASWKNFVPIFLKEYKLSVVREVLAPLAGEADYLITSRIDNDDAMSKYFVNLVQQKFNKQRFEVISFIHGFILRQDEVFLSRQQTNTFISLIERARNFKTVWHGSYETMCRLGHMTYIAGPAGWLQVVHPCNVYNRVQFVVRRCQGLPGSFDVRVVTAPVCQGTRL